MLKTKAALFVRNISRHICVPHYMECESKGGQCSHSENFTYDCTYFLKCQAVGRLGTVPPLTLGPASFRFLNILLCRSLYRMAVLSQTLFTPFYVMFRDTCCYMNYSTSAHTKP